MAVGPGSPRVYAGSSAPGGSAHQSQRASILDAGRADVHDRHQEENNDCGDATCRQQRPRPRSTAPTAAPSTIATRRPSARCGRRASDETPVDSTGNVVPLLPRCHADAYCSIKNSGASTGSTPLTVADSRVATIAIWSASSTKLRWLSSAWSSQALTTAHAR